MARDLRNNTDSDRLHTETDADSAPSNSAFPLPLSVTPEPTHTADIMADDPHNTSDVSESIEGSGAKEDAETTAARRELKQTSISERIAGEQGTKTSTQDDQSGSDDDAARGTKAATGRITPDTDLGDSKGDLRERVASPKKKRAHAELIADGSSTTSGEGSSKPPVTAVTQTRTEASEPEKKRHRDAESTRRRSQDGEVSCVPYIQGDADGWAHTRCTGLG